MVITHSGMPATVPTAAPASPAAEVLRVDDICVQLGNEMVLEDVTFTVRQGEFVGIAGPNGGGKSTLLRAILGLVPTCCGHVHVFGLPTPNAGVQRRMAYLAQNEAHVDPLFPATALEVAQLGRVPKRGLLRRLTAADRAAALQALEEVGVAHLKDRLVGSLSGGQRQRVLLAKALASQPELLLLDEPTTGIDPKARDDFHHLLADLNQRKGLTVMLVSHDTDFLAHVAQRVILLDRRIHFDGDPKARPDVLAHLHNGHGHGHTATRPASGEAHA
jgi:zinc transport system ATP-binding protein